MTDLWASPSKPPTLPDSVKFVEGSRTLSDPSHSKDGELHGDRHEARDAALRMELESVRKINQVIEGVIESLARAKDNMETVSRTVNSASTLLNTWTRILSQTEHNQRLILNPSWHGATQDIADTENESILRQQQVARREIEERNRREALARKAGEEERKKAEATSAKEPRWPARGRARSLGRTPSATPHTETGGGTRGAIRSSASRGLPSSRRPRVNTSRGPGVARSRGRVRGTS